MAQFYGVIKLLLPINNGNARSFLILKESPYKFFIPVDISQLCSQSDKIIITTTELQRESSKIILPEQIVSIKVKRE